MLKKLFVGLFLFVLVIFVVIISADLIIKYKSKDYLYNETSDIPKNKVGLLLGTSKYLSNGNVNLYFKYRIEAALELYRQGKVRYFVVSGDNSRNDYNEPKLMKEDLIAGGIPASVIHLDYAGFRTLDSVVRVDKIFGQKQFTIISQPFHNERAVYIARKNKLDVIAYNARDVKHYAGIKTQIRERFARVKVFIDLIINKKPKFLGEAIEIV